MSKKTYVDNVKEKTLVDLTLNTKKPKTKFEKDLARDIKEIEKKGGIVYIPSDL
jgi:hypothetical protein